MNAGAIIPPNADALEQAPEAAHVQGEPFIDMSLAIAEAQSPADCPPPESADDALTCQVQAELRMRCGRQRGRVIEALQIHVAGDMALIICATFADLDIVSNRVDKLTGQLKRNKPAKERDLDQAEFEIVKKVQAATAVKSPNGSADPHDQ